MTVARMAQPSNERTDKSLRVLLAAKDRRIAALEREVHTLRQQLDGHLSRAYAEI